MAQPQPRSCHSTKNGNLSETNGTVQCDVQTPSNTMETNDQQNDLPQNTVDRTFQQNPPPVQCDVQTPSNTMETNDQQNDLPQNTVVRTFQQNPPPPIANQIEDHEDRATFFKEIRGNLMIVAILAAGSTYQAGLNPPGGDWQADDKQGHIAGNPVLHDKFFNRYQAFFYCNAISFMSSLVVIILLMNKHFYRDMKKVKALEITMVLDLFSFMAAYAVGSCRRVSSSIYVFLLMGGVFVYVLSFALHYSILRERVHSIRTRARV